MKSKPILLTVLLTITALMSCVPLTQVSASSRLAQTQTPDSSFNLAIVGDSNADEYRADDNRGGDYGYVTFNWIEQLVDHRGVNVGKWAKWGGYRRTGYEYNFAKSGGTTASALAAGAPQAVAKLVEAGKVQYVYYALGENDIASEKQIFLQIYSGQLSGDALDAYIGQIMKNITTSLDIINASHKAKVLVSTIPDPTISAAAQAQLPDPTKRQAVADVFSTINEDIRVAAWRRGYMVFDVNKLGGILLSRLDLQGNIVVGGEKFSFAASGFEPHHMLLDGQHIGTVVSGLYANEWMATANAAFGTDLQPFTDAELLAHAEIKHSTQSASASQNTSTVSTDVAKFIQKLFSK